MKIRTLMTKNVTCISPSDSLCEAYNLMHELEVRHLPVVDENNQLVGILSNRDILLEATSDNGVVLVPSVDVESVMTTDVVTCRTSDSLSDIAETLLSRKIDAIPVVDGFGEIIGIITSTDFIELALRRPAIDISEYPEIPFQFNVNRFKSNTRLRSNYKY